VSDPIPASDPTETLPRPRIRTGAAIWGLLLLALGAASLWVALSPERRDDFVQTMLTLDGFDITVIVVIALGGALTLVALAAVIRRVQTRR
jgi:hypothetical protein